MCVLRVYLDIPCGPLTLFSRQTLANTIYFRLIYKGYKKTLEETDLWKPSPRHLTSSTMPLLEAAWQKEMAKCRRFVILLYLDFMDCMRCRILSVNLSDYSVNEKHRKHNAVAHLLVSASQLHS